MKSIFEEMGGTYTLGEDGRYYPDLTLPIEEEPHYGRYGRMRLAYLKEHRTGFYNTLLLDGKLISHLNTIDDQAHQRMALLTWKMREKQGVYEALKAHDQMGRVRAMNNIRNAAEKSFSGSSSTGRMLYENPGRIVVQQYRAVGI